MACKDKKKFVTAEAASKAKLRTDGVIDKYLNILNLNEFRKLNRSWSDYAKEKFKTKGMLFDEWNNRAIPNSKEFTKIDNQKGIYYKSEDKGNFTRDIDNLGDTTFYQKKEDTRVENEEKIDNIFKSNPELKSVGSKIEYSKYLNSIFPDSKVKDIVYHGTRSKFESFSKETLGEFTGSASAKEGFFFASNIENSKRYANEFFNLDLPSIFKDFNFTVSEIESIQKEYKEIVVKLQNLIVKQNELQSETETNNNELLILEKEKNNLINNIIKYINNLFNLGFVNTSQQIDVLKNKIIENKNDNNKILKEINDLSKFINDFSKLFISLKTEQVEVEAYNSNVMSVILNVSDKITFDDLGESYRAETYFDRLKKAKKENKDGVIILNTYDPIETDVFVVFEPEQIHVLGSKKDVKGFKDFKQNSKTKEEVAEEIAEEYRNDVYQELFGTSFKEFYTVVEQEVNDSDTSFMRQAKILARNFGVQMKFDENLDSSGKIVYSKDGKITLTVNPNYLQEDTLAHEYGHLLIDIIGVDNMRIQAALKQLEGSNLEKEVMDKYPELQGDNLKREILATALGRKGIEVFNSKSDQSWWDRFTDWFFNLIGARFKNNEVAKLAKELWNPSESYVNREVNIELEQLQKLMTHEKKIKTTDLKSIMSKYRDVLTVKINRWKNNTAADSKNYTKGIQEIRNQIDSFLELENTEGIINLVDHAYTQFKQIKKRVAEDDLSSDTLVTIKSFIRSFEPLKDLNTFIEDNRDKMVKMNDMSEELVTEMEAKLTELISNEKKIEAKTLRLSKKIIAGKFSQMSNRVERIYEITEERRLKAENPNITNSELEDKLIQHIEDNKDTIAKQNYQYFYNILEESVDIEAMWKILDSGQVNSSLIQLTQKVLDRADLNINSKYMSARKEIKELKDEFDSVNSSLNQETKFKKFIYQGEESDYLVGEYNPEFLDKHTTLLNAMLKEAEDVEEGDKTPAANAFDKWLKENTIKVDEVVDGIVRKVTKPADKWKSNLDLTTKEKEILDKIKAQFKYQDKQIKGSNSELINNKFFVEFIKLPQQEKSNAQRIRESGFINTVTGAVGDVLKRRSTDLDLNNANNQEEDLFHKRGFATEDNKSDYRVPVYYRRKIEKKDRSRDLFTLMLSNAYTSLNYHEKSLASADLELLSDILEEKKYTKRANSKYWVNALNKKQTLDAETNREYQMLRSIMENRLYGLGEVEQILFGDVSANKLNNFINGWSASVMLGLNYMSAVPNFAMGKTMNFVEAVGGLIYDRENLRNAEKAYWQDLPNVMGDFNAVAPKAKTSILLDYFEILNDSSSMNTKFVDDGSFRSKMKKDTMFFLSHSVEHNVQATQMYAVLDALQHKGDKLIDLMYVKDGELKFKKPIPEVLINKAKSRIKKVIADGQGQYDQRMKPEFQREWYGKSAMMFRKWIPRGVTKRFKGFKNIAGNYADFENSNDFENFFSEESDMFEEGHYVSFLRMLHKDFKTYKLNYLKKYKSLTRYEQANVRKTLAEMSIALGFFITTTVLANLASDEDDEATQRMLYMSAYWTRRTYSEIRFFSSVPDALKILKSPAASLTMIDNLFDVLTAGNEQYQKNYRGYEKGDYKIFKEIKDITPLRNQLFKYENPEDALSFLTK